MVRGWITITWIYDAHRSVRGVRRINMSCMRVNDSITTNWRRGSTHRERRDDIGSSWVRGMTTSWPVSYGTRTQWCWLGDGTGCGRGRASLPPN
jgi:hypothetical protein